MPKRRASRFAALTFSLAACSAIGEARADAASWLFVGGGGARLDQAGGVSSQPALMQIDLGLGTSPSSPFVFGGLVRQSTFFGDGTDLGLLSRTATRGFALGDYGLALDLGVSQRFWGPSSTALSLSLDAGAPWGLTLGLNGSLARDSVRTLSLVVGIDWARFTAHRRSGTSWWPSYPLPLGDDDVAAR
jgi:hypothetical protein